MTARRNAIRASGNVSSVTDNGTGNYTINFTTAMPDANFSLCGTALGVSNGSISVTAPSFDAEFCTFSTVTNANAAFDPSIVSVAIFR